MLTSFSIWSVEPKGVGSCNLDPTQHPFGGTNTRIEW
jgi:hypothetical protein